jgi:hypothetical protein
MPKAHIIPLSVIDIETGLNKNKGKQSRHKAQGSRYKPRHKVQDTSKGTRFKMQDKAQGSRYKPRYKVQEGTQSARH